MAETPRRVLMTLADVAWPIDAGKRLRASSMVRAVALRCQVDVVILFADADPGRRPVPAEVDATWQLLPPLPRSSRSAAWSVLRDRVPWQIAVQDWAPVRRLLTERDTAYDLVWFGALDHFVQLRGTVAARAVVVDCDDVETEKLRTYLALPRIGAAPLKDRVQRRVELPLWARIQRQAVRHADAVLVCSELDRTRLAHEVGGTDPTAVSRIFSVPNTYPEPTEVSLRRPEGPCTLVVVANYGTDQNVDAANFTALEVLPALRAQMAGARIRLVGRRLDRLEHLAGIDGLDLVGPVDSVADELAGAHAVLVPIRFGGGTRLKVIEAFAYRRPVVSTHAGAEGIDVVDGVHLMLADTPKEIVAAVLCLLAQSAVSQSLVEAGRSLYEQQYRPQSTATAVGSILDRVLDRRQEQH